MPWTLSGSMSNRHPSGDGPLNRVSKSLPVDPLLAKPPMQTSSDKRLQMRYNLRLLASMLAGTRE
jgi:hypothetical protein